MTDVTTTASQKYERRWWIGLGLGMAVVFAVNFYFIWLSSSASPPLVTPAYYQQSLQYEKVLEQADATRRSGFVLELAPGAPFVLTIREADGAVAGVTGTVELYRPNDPGRDQAVPLSAFVRGHPEIELESGRWDLSVSIFHTDGRQARLSRSVVLPLATGVE